MSASATGRPPASPVITSHDRLITTLFFAALLHGIVILGVGFSGAMESPQQISRLEVTMVTPQASERPDEADYLAQVDQRGQGTTGEKVRPQTPASTPARIDNPGLREARDAFHSTTAQTPSERPDSPRPASSATSQPLLVDAPSSLRLQPEEQSVALPFEYTRVARLIQQQFDGADPTDSPRREPVAAGQPDETRLTSVNTHRRAYAGYLHEWREQVERVGNLHFPDEAARRNAWGNVTVEVALDADGSLADVRILRSSGHRVLDDAVLRILGLAAPFAPFSSEMREDSDRLRFVYEWRFHPPGENGPSGRVSR